ncbi:hypothetical protein [Bradyrhizobium cosmicum]|uniref:Uncharacterized protein n=1 Tax=Bradyrhizobium cosmicum TaxID=1404864 RepID=A0AAI8Q913_9BRAD|nr:hypothetical protein [Bradyrhizobium cosmicum]BAL73747.1 hypothetical protein S23_05260 [Bradyrhizobium cosmicum]
MSSALTNQSAPPAGIEPLRYPADRSPTKALAIYRTFERFHERKIVASKSHQQRQDALRAEKALLQSELDREMDGRLPRIDDARVTHLKAALADIDSQIAANEAAQASDPLNCIVGLNQIDEQWREQRGPFKDRNTTDTAIDGKTPEEMLEHWGDEIVRLEYEVEGIWLQPVSRAEIEARIIADVAALASGSISVDAVRYVRPRGITKRPMQGHVKFPMALTAGKETVDLAAVLLAVPTIKNSLIAFLVEKALADHDESTAVTPMQREQAVAAARRSQTEARYKCAYWYRKLIDAGRYVPARTTDALALLDIE